MKTVPGVYVHEAGDLKGRLQLCVRCGVTLADLSVAPRWFGPGSFVHVHPDTGAMTLVEASRYAVRCDRTPTL